MDICLQQGNATIVAFISGDASFYTSTGGGVNRRYRPRKCPQRRLKFIAASVKYIDRMTPTTAYPLPGTGQSPVLCLDPLWDLYLRGR